MTQVKDYTNKHLEEPPPGNYTIVMVECLSNGLGLWQIEQGEFKGYTFMGKIPGIPIVKQVRH